MTKSSVSSFSMLPVVFVLMLFLLLSVLSGAIIMAGSNVYQKIADNMEINYDKRVSLSYLTTKVRQNDSKGNIYLTEKKFDDPKYGAMDVKLLTIKESDELTGFEYVTYLYYYDGFIREVFLDLDENGETIDFELGDGDAIIASNDFEFVRCDRCVEFVVTDPEGERKSTKIYLRSN